MPERSIQVRILFGKDIAGKQPADGRSHCRWSDARELDVLHMVAPRKKLDIANDFDARLRRLIGLVFLEPLREPRFTCQRSSGRFVAWPRCIGRLAHCAAQNGCGNGFRWARHGLRCAGGTLLGFGKAEIAIQSLCPKGVFCFVSLNKRFLLLCRIYASANAIDFLNTQ